MGWPISQRGADMEQTAEQQQAADRMNKNRIDLAQKRQAEKLAKKKS